VLTLAGTSSGDELWYAGASDGIYVSRDAGMTWQRSNIGLAAGEEETSEIVVDPVHSATAYAGTRGGAYKTVETLATVPGRPGRIFGSFGYELTARITI
jgi:photosystem II stability/assembly factor-like uncharacterized protein